MSWELHDFYSVILSILPVSQMESKNKTAACSILIQILICLYPAFQRAHGDWLQPLDFCMLKRIGTASVYYGMEVTKKPATGQEKNSLRKLGMRWTSALGVK